MTLNEIFNTIRYDNWRLPNEEELQKEFLLKQKKRHYYEDLDIEGANLWDSWENIKKAISQGKVERLPYHEYYKVDRLSGGNTLQSLHDMSLNYRSGPRDPFRIAKGFEDGDKIPMAMVIDHGGRLVLTAGNTRLNAARICNLTPPPKILIIPSIVK